MTQSDGMNPIGGKAVAQGKGKFQIQRSGKKGGIAAR